MKIAYLINQYPRVSHTFIRREIKALEDRGLSISRYSLRPCDQGLVDPEDEAEASRTQAILALGPAALLRHFATVALIRPLRLGRALILTLGAWRRSDRGLVRHLAYLVEACALWRLMQRSGTRHLHAHFGTNSALVAMLCCAFGDRSYSFTVHGPEEFDRPESLFLREKIHRARFVVAISEFGRSQLYRWCRLEDWPKVHIVRCGVDEGFLAQPHRDIPAGPRLVCICRLSLEKGVPVLLQAFRTLREQGTEATLVIAGDGPDRPAIQELVAEHGLGGCVRFTGWVSGDRIKDLLLDSRALIVPSFAEGLPVVLMEAMALGRPVVSTWIAGVPELVEPGVNGWLVAPGSADALARAVGEVLRSPPARLAAMGARGAQRVARLHDARGTTETLARLLQATPAGDRV